MKCPKCGTENHEEAKFCLQCGQSFEMLEQGEIRPAEPVQTSQTQLPRGNGVLILVLGILGLILCPPIGIIAWIMGHQELNKIRLGQVSNQDEGLARAGKILGIIGTIYFIVITILLAFYIIFIAFVASGRITF